MYGGTSSWLDNVELNEAASDGPAPLERRMGRSPKPISSAEALPVFRQYDRSHTAVGLFKLSLQAPSELMHTLSVLVVGNTVAGVTARPGGTQVVTLARLMVTWMRANFPFCVFTMTGR